MLSHMIRLASVQSFKVDIAPTCFSERPPGLATYWKLDSIERAKASHARISMSSVSFSITTAAICGGLGKLAAASSAIGLYMHWQQPNSLSEEVLSVN